MIFKDYVESRIEFFAAGRDTSKIYQSLRTSYKIQELLWNRAANIGQDQSNFARTSQMVPALNAGLMLLIPEVLQTWKKYLNLLFMYYFFFASLPLSCLDIQPV
jgi:hypothetical protein